jgi:glucose/sorbosone dehydrogenase
MSGSRRWLLALASAVMAIGLAAPPSAQARADEPIPDPLPDPVPSTLGITVEEYAQFPKTEPTPTPTDQRLVRWARINHLGEVPDGSGRQYVPDLNGKFYLLRDGVPQVYIDILARYPDFVSGRGLGTGSGFITFHPDFAHNGKLYTVHTEWGDALGKPTTFPGQDPVLFQGIITEWTADDPSADVFSGTSREIMRLGFGGQVHGIQQIDFNDTAEPGDPDYGMLYLTVGDGGKGASGTWPQDRDTPFGKLLRIDPLGTDSANGQYGIPKDNPFADPDDGTLDEIYAIGMRDPHRISWDSADGRMFLGHIGEHRIESVYDVRAGDNYGWSEREGPFLFKRGDAQCGVYPLPPDDDKYGYTYPVAAFDHNPPPGHPLCSDSGHAISGGYVYRGEQIRELQGKYVFTDLVDGRIFYTEAREMRRGQPMAQIHQLMVYDAAGERVTFQDLVGDKRVDLRFGRDAAGELYLIAKANGKIWKVTGAKRFAGCDVGDDRVTHTGGARNWQPHTPDNWTFRGDQVIMTKPGTAPEGPRRPFEYAILKKGPEFSSATISAKVRLDTPVEVTNRDVIIVFGYQSDTRYYYAHLSTDNTIYPHNGIFVVNDADRLRIDDQWDETQSRGAPPAVTDADWHKVSVTHCASTGEIAVYVDGAREPLMTAVDTTFGAGRTGFGSFDNIGRAREFSVRGTAVR